jgi:hypothetical protein
MLFDIKPPKVTACGLNESSSRLYMRFLSSLRAGINFEIEPFLYSNASMVEAKKTMIGVIALRAINLR